MVSNGGEACRILEEINKLEAEKSRIEDQIGLLKAQLTQQENDSSINELSFHNGLSPDAIYRYSRQLLLPTFGVEAQSKLLKSSILVVGAGGLGSPALLYLAAAGVGFFFGVASSMRLVNLSRVESMLAMLPSTTARQTSGVLSSGVPSPANGRLGIVDHDIVELNNLHRQIIHAEAYIGQSKVKSAAAACRAINSTVEIVEHREALRASNALEIVSKYDIVIDATDNAPSRYLVNDCCLVLGKPLISGAAVGLEGQLTVYNYNGGPCYRCLFPTPPPTSACQRCSDSGVLGVVPGVIGCLQALEAIKVASCIGEPLSGRMLLFDALSGRIRIVKLRGRSSQCEACGEDASFTQEKFRNFDYENFTQSPFASAPMKLKLVSEGDRISSREYASLVTNKEAHVLVDVRPSHHYKIVSLPNSLNIPLSSLGDNIPAITSALKEQEKASGSTAALYLVCRRGNDSQRAVHLLHQMGFTSAKDIIGGIESWASDVDPKFPTY